MKLPDLRMDFLPPSHTAMHQKQGIEDCVQKQVQAWDYTRPVEVLLTSGYGRPLPWVLNEFKPATAELLQQYQYLQDVETGQSVRFEKWSPPLGITKLDPSDIWRFEMYLDELMTVEHLPELPWTFYEEESQFDGFQATMLDMICKLYLATIDRDVSRSHARPRSTALTCIFFSCRNSSTNSYAWSSSPTSWAIPSQSPQKRFQRFTNTSRIAENQHD